MLTIKLTFKLPWWWKAFFRLLVFAQKRTGAYVNWDQAIDLILRHARFGAKDMGSRDR